VQRLGAGSAPLGSTGNRKSSDDDAPSGRDLVVSGNGLTTASQLLVADDEDDDFAINGIADDPPHPVKNDRSHKVSLGGRITLSQIKLKAAAHIITSFGKRQLADLMAVEIERWLHRLGVGPQTWRNYAKVIGSVFRWP